MSKETHIHQKRPTKETYKRDQEKGPTHIKRDHKIKKRPLVMVQEVARHSPYILKRDLHTSKETDKNQKRPTKK